ncbi:MAG: hypothetical protein QNJ09_03100 [Paracoccaceae bacterium]|nr:hypothetical protein [Paracoccaceae bacterium]
MDLSALETRGWIRFPVDPAVLAWAQAAREAGRVVLADPEMRAQWLQCEGTWFVGVDALPTAPDGSIGGVPLGGAVIEALGALPPLHPAQLSITFPGYPRPRAGESAAAFRYRQRRDAAHVDGITAEGPDRRRFLTEPHAFILGLPLTETAGDASPLVVWDGSPGIIRDGLAPLLQGVPPEHWPSVDLTEAYQAARRRCFDSCERLTLPAQPGEALLVHRACLHGVAPWDPGATAPADGRMIAYFRPLMAERAAWLSPDALPA